MRRKANEPFFLTGLDIGTKKISIVVMETDPVTSESHVISIGSVNSKGIKKGDIIEPDLCVESIVNAIEKVESSSVYVSDAILSVGPSEVDSIILNETIRLREEGAYERPVTSSDMIDVVREAIFSARARSDECLLHAVPLEFSVDQSDFMTDPRGYKGTELTVSILAIFAPFKSIRDAVDCAEKAGLNVVGVIHKSISAGFGSLLPEEMDNGCVAVNIGAGTTSAAFFKDGKLQNLALFPIGGDQVTSDLASVLGVPSINAEYLKREVALSESGEDLYDELEFALDGKAFITSVEEVLSIISPRIEEILSRFLKPVIDSFGSEEAICSIVFSGGVAKTPGLLSFVEPFFGAPVRIGTPVDPGSLPLENRGSEFTSAVGIVNYFMEKENNPDLYLEPSLTDLVKEAEGSKDRKKWIDEFFKKWREFTQALKNAFSELF
ncbi:MAG: cell division protein FtsA [Thermovirgaceae bacterium]|nr:cell division protein FtsA [Thermovirgaceae bacterium]